MGEYTDKIKGKAKQVQGDLTDDDSKRIEGELQEQRGKLKGTFERAKARVKDVLEEDKA